MADSRWAGFSDRELRELFIGMRSADEYGEMDDNTKLLTEMLEEGYRRGVDTDEWTDVRWAR